LVDRLCQIFTGRLKLCWVLCSCTHLRLSKAASDTHAKATLCRTASLLSNCCHQPSPPRTPTYQHTVRRTDRRTKTLKTRVWHITAIEDTPCCNGIDQFEGPKLGLQRPTSASVVVVVVVVVVIVVVIVVSKAVCVTSHVSWYCTFAFHVFAK